MQAMRDASGRSRLWLLAAVLGAGLGAATPGTAQAGVVNAVFQIYSGDGLVVLPAGVFSAHFFDGSFEVEYTGIDPSTPVEGLALLRSFWALGQGCDGPSGVCSFVVVQLLSPTFGEITASGSFTNHGVAYVSVSTDFGGGTAEFQPFELRVDGANRTNGLLNMQTTGASGSFNGYLVWRSFIGECNDGFDNDFDGLVDHPADPGCTSAFDAAEGSECDDGIDNDADGYTDDPADPGCAHPNDRDEKDEDLVCDDGLDNDSDGLVDYVIAVVGTGDPGCRSPNTKSETTECDDGVDNDLDGLTDRSDGDCRPGWDNSEGGTAQGSCGLGFELALLLPALEALRRRAARRRQSRPMSV
jgi:hypothetical protein